MRLTMLAAVVVVSASPSVAEEAVPLSTPTWSLGAGLTIGAGSFVGLGALSPGAVGAGGLTASGLGALGSIWSPVVSPNLSLERQFSSRFALGLGLEATLSGSSTVGDSLPAPVSGGVGVGVSPRVTLTPEGAPVSFAVFVPVFTGYSSFSFPMTAQHTYSAQVLTAGLGAGIALERRFFDRFAVRLSAQLVRVSWLRVWSVWPQMDSDGTTFDVRRVTSSYNASFLPVPSLELRLYL